VAQDLTAAYQNYQALPVLAGLSSREPFVPGTGPAGALMMIGEIPGLDESIHRVPFAGEAEELLCRELEDAGLPVAYTFFTLAVKYRTPGGRDPYPFELEASRPCLIAEILAIRPVVIGALGETVLQVLGIDPPYGAPRWYHDWSAPGVDWSCHVMALPSVRAALEDIHVQMGLIEGLQMIGGAR